jgi:hypothetical protein
MRHDSPGARSLNSGRTGSAMPTTTMQETRMNELLMQANRSMGDDFVGAADTGSPLTHRAAHGSARDPALRRASVPRMR